MRSFLVALTLAAVAAALLVLPGCQGLATALGMQPTAQAPVFNGQGVLAFPGAWVDIMASPDQSGAVGASGSASQDTKQAQAVSIDPEALAGSISEVAELVVPGGRAATALSRAEEALAGGDLVKADKLTRAARGFAKAEAPPPVEDPAPVVEPAPDEAPVPAPPPAPAPEE